MSATTECIKDVANAAKDVIIATDQPHYISLLFFILVIAVILFFMGTAIVKRFSKNHSDTIQMLQDTVKAEKAEKKMLVDHIVPQMQDNIDTLAHEVRNQSEAIYAVVTFLQMQKIAGSHSSGDNNSMQ